MTTRKLDPIHPGEILREEFPPVLAQLEQIVDEIRELDRELEALKAPWTPGRVPELN